MSEIAIVEAPAALVHRRPAEIREWMDQVQEMRRSVLVQGTDYMVIPGTPKPSLLQPGAEKMLMLAGLGYKMERVEERPDGVTYKCSVLRGEQVLAECDGYAGYDEEARNGKPVFKSWNTVVKMAQKRAKVGAISSALALSGIFTTDLGDTSPNTVDLVNPYLETLTEHQRTTLKDWRKAMGMPPPSEMTLEQMADVLVQIGIICATPEPQVPSE